MTVTLNPPTEAPAPTAAPVPEAAQEGAVKTKQVVFVAESGDLEKTWATLILATTAAASGLKATIFFTFWGLEILVRDDVRITGENLMQKMLAVMNRPGIDHLKLSRLNMLGMGPWMMKRLANKYGVAQPKQLFEIAQAMGVRLIPCQMTMDMFGLKREQLVQGLEEPAGAATAIQLMAEADATLFI